MYYVLHQKELNYNPSLSPKLLSTLFFSILPILRKLQYL